MLTITPYLFYEDVASAVTWLSDAFDFHEVLRYTEPDGTVMHAELTYGGESVMLGHFAPGYRNPLHTGHLSGFVFVMVEHVDAHFERAKRCGATVVAEPQDWAYGQRQYTVEDPEGHRWSFAEQVRDVLPEEWGAQQTGAPRSTEDRGAPATLRNGRLN